MVSDKRRSSIRAGQAREGGLDHADRAAAALVALVRLLARRAAAEHFAASGQTGDDSADDGQGRS